MNDTLNGVDVFVASVESGSFAAAAERLQLSRSAIAKTIARMESRLHVRLFHRTTRSVTLTEEGQVYYECCIRALDALRTGAAALDSGRHEVSGRLRVSAPILFGRRCVAPVLAPLTVAHPQLELNLSLSDRYVDVLEDGFDIAIRSGSGGNGSGLMTRAISQQRMTVCASPAYLAQHGQPHTLEDLAQHSTIVYGRTGYTRTWQFPVQGGPIQEVTPPSRLRFDDLETIADHAQAGYGLAWLPCWLIQDKVSQGTLVTLLDKVPRLVFKLYALWPSTPHLPLRTRYALDALVQGLPNSA